MSISREEVVEIQRNTNIRNVGELIRTLGPWKLLNGCFGPHIRVSDIDGVVERNGYFLWLEWKGTGAPVASGQALMYDRLRNNSQNRDTVVLGWGDTRTGVVTHTQVLGVNESPIENDLLGYEDIMRRWFAKVDTLPLWQPVPTLDEAVANVLDVFPGSREA